MNKNALNETRPITSSWYNVFSYWTFSKSGIFGFFLPTVYFLWLSCFVVIPLLLNKRWAIVALTIGLKVKTTTTWSKWHFWIILYIFINMIHFTMSKLKKKYLRVKVTVIDEQPEPSFFFFWRSASIKLVFRNLKNH